MKSGVVVLTLGLLNPVSGQLVTTVPDFPVSDVTGAPVYRPHVSVHPTDGSFLISWGDDRFGSGSGGRLAGIGDIFVSRFAPDGTTNLADSRVGDVHFGFFSEFSMYDSSPLLMPNGDILAAYHVDARTTVQSIKYDDLYFSTYSATGQSIVLDRQVNMAGGSASGYAYQPTAVRFGANILFTFRYYVNDLYHIGVAVVDGSTYVLDGDATVIDNATTGSRGVPAVASNGTRTIVAWADSRNDADGDIYAQMFQGTSTSGTNIKVNDDAGARYNQYPRAAINASGRGVVVWIDTRDNAAGDLFGQVYDSNGNAVGQNIKLTSSNSALWEYPPGVGMDATGNFVVTWTDSVAGGAWRAKTRLFNEAGTPVTGILELTFPISESIQPDVAVEPDGRATFTWVDGRLDGNNGRIFAKRAQLTVTSTEDEPNEIPAAFSVRQNFPNPFNPATTILIQLAEPSHLHAAVYDVLGRQVAVLADEDRAAGPQMLVWEAGDRPAGSYLCRVRATSPGGGQRDRSIRMVYLR